MQTLRGTLSNPRQELLEKVWFTLDPNKTGSVNIQHLKSAFVTHNHPDVQVNKRCQEEILDEFIETLDLWRF